MFDHVRVPRVNLLNKYGEVEPDGTYTLADRQPQPPVLHHAGHPDPRPGHRGRQRRRRRAVALDIATRYALQRKQFSSPDDDSEVLIMDYLVHQRRLFPLIARSYALQFAQNELVAKCHDLQTRTSPTPRSSASWKRVRPG